MLKVGDQRPPRASVYLGWQVASKLGTHGPGVAVGAGHLKWEKFSCGNGIGYTLPQIHLMADFSACPGTEVLFLAL